jgi:ATP-dependent DNA helicase UvrD/PcrA
MRSVEALSIPTVAAAAQQQHRYILVDEFQDINYASGELVRLLDGGRGRVWAVGDPWQSIYRFRGASPINLRQFTVVYPSATSCDLKLNYRSLQPILDASHALMEPDPLAAVRERLRAWRSDITVRNVVEWVLDDAEAEASAIAHDILRRVHRSPRDLPRCTRLRGQPQRVQRPPLDRLRRRHFADHAVLCRTHTQADRIAAALRAHGVPVDQTGDLFDAPEVKDALAILAMIGAASSAGTLRALTIPEQALDAADLATLTRLVHAVKLALPRAVHDRAIVTRLSRAGQEQIASLHALVDDLAGCADAWQALVQYLFEQSITMRNRITAVACGNFAARRALAILGQLIALARNFVRQAPPHECAPRHFVAYVRLLIEAGERTTAVVPVEHADVVQVMAVHAAKGLEFPIVYVPGLQEGVFPPRKQYGSIPSLPGLAHGDPSDDFQEERYLLYVAMTRARDQLILSRAAARGEKPVKRSPLLPGGAEGTDAPWPILRRATRGPCPEPFDTPRLVVAPIMRTPIPATSIETYERCPRQYLYQYGFQLTVRLFFQAQKGFVTPLSGRNGT